MDSLKGQVAIINGASRGMGAAIAELYAAEGAKVGLLARTQADLDAVAAKIRAKGCVAEVAVADVRERQQVFDAIGKLRAALGPVDILVNSTGAGINAYVHEMTDEIWERSWDTNVKGSWLCIQAVLNDMMERKSGLIINIGSMAGLVPGGAGGTLYIGAKWALVGMSRCLSMELRAHNIRVTLLNPGTTDTPFRPQEYGKHPDWMQAEDVAQTALFVATLRPEVSLHEINFSVTKHGW